MGCSTARRHHRDSDDFLVVLRCFWRLCAPSSAARLQILAPSVRFMQASYLHKTGAQRRRRQIPRNFPNNAFPWCEENVAPSHRHFYVHSRSFARPSLAQHLLQTYVSLSCKHGKNTLIRLVSPQASMFLFFIFRGRMLTGGKKE